MTIERQPAAGIAGFILMVAACGRGASHPPDEPRAEVADAHADEAPARFTEHGVSIEFCRHGVAPARALFPSEVGRLFDACRSGCNPEREAELLEDLDLASWSLEDRQHAALQLAHARLITSEHRLGWACKLAAEGARSDRLTVALGHAHRELLVSKDAALLVVPLHPDRLTCVRSIVATRLGDVDEARELAGQLGSTPCDLQARVEFGQLLARVGEHAEAEAAFADALALDHALAASLDTPALACPVLHDVPGYQVGRDVPYLRPDIGARWCSWAEFLEYRSIHATLAAGRISASEAAEALSRLADTLRAAARPGAETIVAAIAIDLANFAREP